MNRSLTLHPLSLVVGIAFCAICLLSMGLAPSGGHRVVVEYGPAARDMVQIREGISYTVPPGSIFVLTAVGTATNASLLVSFAVNGQTEVEAKTEVGVAGSSTDTTTVKTTPAGFTATAGSILTVSGGDAPADARAWGYLAPQ